MNKIMLLEESGTAPVDRWGGGDYLWPLVGLTDFFRKLIVPKLFK